MIGSDVNLASRLVSEARPDECLVSEKFFAALREKPPEAGEIESLRVKGFPTEIPCRRVPIEKGGAL